jgi:multidrug efflux pump subunit AcrB
MTALQNHSQNSPIGSVLCPGMDAEAGQECSMKKSRPTRKVRVRHQLSNTIPQLQLDIRTRTIRLKSLAVLQISKLVQEWLKTDQVRDVTVQTDVGQGA